MDAPQIPQFPHAAAPAAGRLIRYWLGWAFRKGVAT